MPCSLVRGSTLHPRPSRASRPTRIADPASYPTRSLLCTPTTQRSSVRPLCSPRVLSYRAQSHTRVSLPLAPRVTCHVLARLAQCALGVCSLSLAPPSLTVCTHSRSFRLRRAAAPAQAGGYVSFCVWTSLVVQSGGAITPPMLCMSPTVSHS